MITNDRTDALPRCPICGEGELRPVTRTERFEHETENGPVMVVAHNVPVEVCSNCVEVFSGPEAGRIRDEAIFRAQSVLKG
jgi:YgiT-type zinc finger domain-containing protein